MTFSARDITTIQEQFLTLLLEENSPLSDISQGSSLYTLSRAIAAAQLQQELRLNDLIKDFYITTASGTALDRRAADYLISRKPGDLATGFALAVSQDETFFIDSRLILTEPNTTLQFRVNLPEGINVTSFASVKIPIVCTTVGERGNLPAGTRLISPTFPRISFTIGSHRTSAGEYCGDLINGRDVETDEALRNRIITSVGNSRSTTVEAIRVAVLAQPEISWVSVNQPVRGAVEVWVDSPSALTQTQIANLKTIAELVKAAGILLSLQQATRQYIEIHVTVKPDKTTDMQVLTTAIDETVKKYLLDLAFGQTFKRADLLAQLIKMTGVLEASVTLPTADVVPNASSVLRTQTIKISYVF